MTELDLSRIATLEDTSAASLALVAELGRLTAEQRTIDLTQESLELVGARILREDERIVTESWERFADRPRRPRGTAVLHDPISFAQHVEKLADASESTLWADLNAGTVTCVYNDHMTGSQPAGGLSAGWRDHRAVLQLQPDPEWQAWLRLNGELLGQVAMAEFLEQHAAVVVDPDAATMLEVTRNFSAKRNASFDQRVDLTSSDVHFHYVEETRAQTRTDSGVIEVPRQFTLRLAPYVGVDPEDMIARLRWRPPTSNAGLHLGFVLHRPDVVLREVFAAIVGGISDAVSTPLFWGAAPDPITPL